VGHLRYLLAGQDLAARGVNEEIAKMLEMDPSLRVRYYRLTGRLRPE
jgi:hypothetical protein